MPKFMEPLPEIMDQITSKQRKIAHYLAVGVTSYKVIGQLLSTNPLTIKTHIRYMAEKFGLSGRTQLIVYILTGYRPDAATYSNDEDWL